MTDIVERIDWLYVAEIEAASPDPDMVKTYADAKAEIEHLRADNARLRVALLKIANLEYGCVDDACDAPIIAVAALEGKDE